MSDTSSRRVFRVRNLGPTKDPARNLEVVAGTGEQCLPFDQSHCGEGGKATEAALNNPRGRTLPHSHTHTLDQLECTLLSFRPPSPIAPTHLSVTHPRSHTHTQTHRGTHILTKSHIHACQSYSSSHGPSQLPVKLSPQYNNLALKNRSNFRPCLHGFSHPSFSLCH